MYVTFYSRDQMHWMGALDLAQSDSYVQCIIYTLLYSIHGFVRSLHHLHPNVLFAHHPYSKKVIFARYADNKYCFQTKPRQQRMDGQHVYKYWAGKT